MKIRFGNLDENQICGKSMQAAGYKGMDSYVRTTEQWTERLLLIFLKMNMVLKYHTEGFKKFK